jgi:hypothetical protein
MSNKCPNCGFELDDLNIKRLKSILRSMSLVGRLSDYILNNIPEKDWHPEVKKFSYENLITNNAPS